MNKLLKKFKDSVFDYDINLLEMVVETSGKENYEKLFKFLKERRFKFEFFVTKNFDRTEVKPSIIFPIGPEDRSWNYADIDGNDLGFGFEFYGEYEYMSLTFRGESISSLKKAASLARLMKDLARLFETTVEIKGDKDQTLIASCSNSEWFLKFYPQAEYFDVNSKVFKKVKRW